MVVNPSATYLEKTTPHTLPRNALHARQSSNPPHQLMLTPLPSNNFAEVLRTLAGDGIRELRAKLGVPRAAETDGEGY